MPRYSDLIPGILREVSDLRQNPALYVRKLEQFLTTYHGQVRHRPDEVPILTQEGTEPVRLAIERLLSVQDPLRKCDWSEALSAAAQAHALDTGSKNIVGHVGSDGRQLSERIKEFGDWDGSLAEVLCYGAVTATEVVCALLVDDGLPFREHREALLLPDLRWIGVAFGPHEEQKTVATIILASKFTPKSVFPRVEPPTDVIPLNWEARNWVEGAVRMNCEVTSEMDGKRVKRRVVKKWVLEDGREETTEEVIYN